MMPIAERELMEEERAEKIRQLEEKRNR